MCGNISGLREEIFFSKEFHQVGPALLISSLVLRQRDMGQVDLARLRKDKQGWIIELAEVKSSDTGASAMELSQKRRLLASQRFIAATLGMRTRLINLVR